MLTEDSIEPTKLDAAIDAILAGLSGASADSDEYAKMADQLVKLYKAKEIEAKLKISVAETIVKQDEIEARTTREQTESAMRIRELEHRMDMAREELALRTQETNSKCEQISIETELKKAEAEKPDRVSKDTLAIIGANIAGIVLILGHERLNVITSKALGFVSRLK